MAHMSLVLLLAFCGAAQIPASPAPQDALTDFQRRLQDYLELRNKVQQDAARLGDKATPEEIAKYRAVMAAAIAKARSGATQGDVLAPQVAVHIHAVVRGHLRGRSGAGAREKTKEGNPAVEGSPEPVVLKVNAIYPGRAPVSSVPPGLLQKLPELPDEVQYRFVGRHLILLDATANIILDYMRNVTP